MTKHIFGPCRSEKREIKFKSKCGFQILVIKKIELSGRAIARLLAQNKQETWLVNKLSFSEQLRNDNWTDLISFNNELNAHWSVDVYCIVVWIL